LKIYNNGIGVKGAVALAAYVAGSASLTSVDVSWNNITGDAGGSGPTWKGLVGKERQFTNADSIVADANYIRESILNPSAKIVKGDNGGAYGNMNAGWDKLLSAQDIDMIISYIETLK
ncbi:MAG: hypothetical protein VX026_12070, partial [Myxococcota bacterium]|nr:hypothetical protein [Myxococcota bacterium]